MKSVHMLQEVCIPSSQLNLIFQSRTTWRDLSTWMRAYLASKHGGLGNKDIIKEKIQEMIYKLTNIINLVYGEQSANQYSNLLSNYMSTLDALIDAQISRDANAINQYTNQLYENTAQIATFLSSINPYWVEGEWKNLLNQFNQMTINESDTFLNKDYKANVDIFENKLNLTSKIGDYFSQGILKYLTFSG